MKSTVIASVKQFLYNTCTLHGSDKHFTLRFYSLCDILKA